MKRIMNLTLKTSVLCLLILTVYSFTRIENNDSSSDITHLEFELNSKTYEIAPYDLKKANWTNATKMCENAIINGHNDWRLPTKKELNIIYKTAYRKGVKKGKIIYYNGHNFKGMNGFYLTSTKSKRSSTEVCVKSFYNGKTTTLSIDTPANIRCIRLKQ